MNTKANIYARAHIIPRTKKMQIAKFKVATLTGIIVIAAIINIHLGISLLTGNYVIPSSGTISYGPIETRPLHVEGRYVKDDLGNIVLLRGVNIATYLDCTDGWWLPEQGEGGYGEWDEARVRRHMQRMRDEWGINVIRLMIKIDWWIRNAQETAGGTPASMPYRDAIKRTIELADEYGIYIVPCPWSVRTGAGQAQLPFPPYSGSDPAIIASIDEWIDFWLSVSRELRVYNNVLYSLHNEPAGDQTVWFDAAERCINAIRADGDDHIITVQQGYCGTSQFIEDWLNEGRTTDNVLFENHIYRAHCTICGASTYDECKQALIDRYYLWVVENNVPLWVGETGCWIAYNPEAEERDAWINLLRILNEWELGYAVWEWYICPGRPFGVLEDGTNTPSPNWAGQALIDAIAAGKT